MATLTVADVNSAGVIPSYGAASVNGDQFSNDGKTMIHVITGTSGTLNVTIASQVTCDQGSTHNTIVNVASTSAKMIGPFPTNRFNDANGYVQLIYSQVTNVTIAAFSL